MANQTYLPSTDQGILDFALNMNAYLAANAAAVGIGLPEQTAFDTLTTTYDNAMTTMQNPATRNGPYVVAKNDARDALVSGVNGIRELVNIIQAFPGTTDEARSALQITIRDTEPTPVPPPATQPIITLTGVDDNTVYFRLHDEATPTSRAKPAGVLGANILGFVGDEPPNDFSEWTFMKLATRTTDQIAFPPTVAPLSKVWVSAAWTNSKGQLGPFASARWTNLGGGVSAEAA